MLRAALLIPVLLVATARGQDAPAAPAAPAAPPAPATSPAADRVLARPAMVNNSSITAEDVALQMRLLVPELQRLDPAASAHLARRAVAEEMLLAGEAKRLGVVMDDREVDDWWERRAGSPPDWTGLAASAGTTVARQRELARRAALADLYLLHRCGLRGDQAGRVPPDPMLERVVTITPSQLREAFAQNHAMFDRPEAVTCDLYVTADGPARDAVAAALAAKEMPAMEPITRTFPVAEAARVLPADVAAWLGTAEAGATREVDARTLVAVRERLPAKAATFAESQTRLRNALVDQLLREAREHLVDGLREHATYWPQDLFTLPSKPQPPKASETGTPASG